MRLASIHIILAMVMVVGNALPLAQVNQEIDNLEDLLAVESSNDFISNEIKPQLVEILPAPPGFGGQRLTSAPAPQGPLASGSSSINPDGSYAFRFATEDGTVREESGVPNPEGGHTSTGSFSYVGPDGNLYQVAYEAGIDGFRPVGAHLPTPPPLPAGLQRWEDAKNGNLRKKKRPSSSSVELPRRQGKSLQLNQEDEAKQRIHFRRKLPDQGGRIRFRPSRS